METFTPISQSDIMSWEDILKKEPETSGSFDFNKLEFFMRGENWAAVHNFGEGVKFSIIAGKYTYSIPKEYLENPKEYKEYEVMLIHPKVSNTSEIGLPTSYDDNIFRATKEELSEYARKVEANLPSKMKEKKQKENLGRLIDAFKE